MRVRPLDHRQQAVDLLFGVEDVGADPIRLESERGVTDVAGDEALFGEGLA